MRYVTTSLKLLLCILAISFFNSCEKEDAPPLKPSQFSKDLREGLGDAIQLAIANDPDNFPILHKVPPYDTTAYWYIQKLYDQVTNPIRVNNQSNEDDRWSINRLWRVTILDKNDINAFVLPGGHFYITTGFLNALEDEHELYYVLAFEAALMDGKYLLNRLIPEYNTHVLENISKNIPVEDGTNAHDIALTISNLDFDENDVLEIDNLVAELICNSSLFDRKGIVPILERLQNDDHFPWLDNRFYDSTSRIDYILNVIDEGENCGDFKKNGGYQRYVLDVL